MNDTQTPRTDKAISGLFIDFEYEELLNVSRQLETELTSVTEHLKVAREELSNWRILNAWGGTPEIIQDFIKGQQTRIHHVQNIDEELQTVTEQRDRLAEALTKIASGLWNEDGCIYLAEQALQYLNPKNETR